MHRLVTASVLALALSAGVVSAACSQTLQIALREDPDRLDPALGTTVMGRDVFAGMCDKLFDLDEKLQIVPQLATGYEWQDPKTLIIHLRSGVLFQDNEKMDAAAVKYTLERDLNLPGSFRRSEVNAIDHVDVVDPLTVRVVLKAPNAAFVSQLTDRAGMIVSPAAAEKEGKDFALHPVCAGPFSFGERVAQDHITLNRFPGYWDAKDIHFDKVIYHIMPNTAVRLANLQSGTIDLSEQIVPTDVAAVQKDPKLRIVMSDALGYQGITLNTGHNPQANTPLGRDARVRKAFELSLDRDALNQVVYNGMYVPTAQAVPPASPFYDAALKPPARDVAKAKALLAAAGVKLPVQVNLITPNSPDIEQVAQMIQAMTAETGFDVKIVTMEFASSIQNAQAGNFEAYLLAWSGRLDEDGNTYNFLHTGGMDYGRYENKQVDDLLDEARTVTDIAQRRAIYAKMWDIVSTDLPIIYLWNPRNIVGMSRRISGFRPVPDGLIRLQGLTMAAAQ
jgi:peptide/nickel transport system substrate-binding protein